MTEREPWSDWISRDSITALYADGIERWGGAGSAPREGCVEAALGAAYNAELYSPDYEQTGQVSGLIFAGYLLFYLATKHCFLDGNKRLSLACSLFVLMRFGLTIEATQDEVVDVCLRVSSGQIDDGAAVVKWMAERLKAIE
ncbi:MAG: type II toxin-antitoxin system death-on-curing family toxin [Acidobacteriaceae bacterium]